jgi:hypothetical protein
MPCFVSVSFFFLRLSVVAQESQQQQLQQTATKLLEKTSTPNLAATQEEDHDTQPLSMLKRLVLTDTDQELEGVDDDIGCWRRGSHGCHGGHMAVTQNRQVGRRRRELHVG